MLTGPVTILAWSFPRQDVSREVQSRQLALALRDEVLDLEKEGIFAIQVDEPAIRELMPLRRSDWDTYLKWAVDSFRLSTAGVKDSTQTHSVRPQQPSSDLFVIDNCCTAFLLQRLRGLSRLCCDVPELTSAQNDIFAHIARLDADVISIEASKSGSSASSALCSCS